MPEGLTTPPAAEQVAEFLRLRREQVAQRWAELPLFRSVFTATRDESVEACRVVVDALAAVAASARVDDVAAPGFDSVREQLGRMAAGRSRAGLSAAGIAGEVGELKRTAVELLQAQLREVEAEHRHESMLCATELFGTLRLVVMEAVLVEGQDLIARQRQMLMETATPVIKLWDRVVAVPLIGTLDSARSQVVMETLLDEIVAQQAAVAILDITGVPTVDSLVAQHLMKTVAAARLMGAECIVSGIRPAIAQTIVHLGIDLGNVVTRGTLADALALALQRIGDAPAGGRAPDTAGRTGPAAADLDRPGA